MNQGVDQQMIPHSLHTQWNALNRIERVVTLGHPFIPDALVYAGGHQIKCFALCFHQTLESSWAPLLTIESFSEELKM